MKKTFFLPLTVCILFLLFTPACSNPASSGTSPANPGETPISPGEDDDSGSGGGEDGEKAKILSVSAGGSHTFILMDDGTLWASGANGSGQLGLPNTASANSITQVPDISNVKAVYASNDQTLAIKTNGTLWVAGSNDQGQLGMGATRTVTVFTQVPGVSGVKAVYPGWTHTLIVTNDGTFYGTGRNAEGQLGLANTTNKTTFVPVPIIESEVKGVYVGADHTLVLKNNNTLWAVGRNDYGQLGLGYTGNQTSFIQVPFDGSSIKAVYAAGHHTLILKNNETLVAAGANFYGQIGLGDTTNNQTSFTSVPEGYNIKDVYTGYGHTMILKNNGTLWATGVDTNGKLGMGSACDIFTFTQVPINGSDIKAVYPGFTHTLLLKDDGTLCATGSNSSGQLGFVNEENETSKYTFTEVPL